MVLVMNKKIKKIIKMCYRFVSYIPFVNFYCCIHNHLKFGQKALFNCRIVCHGKNNYIILRGLGTIKNTNIVIYGNNNTIDIGENSSLNKGDICIENDNNTLLIGNNSVLCGETHIAVIEGTKVIIGDNCMLSSKIVFRTGDSHSVIDINGNRINPSKNITIGDHVWIGQDVKILKGVNISNDTVIGTGSIVTKSFFESNLIIAGNPASIKKYNINWLKERI